MNTVCAQPLKLVDDGFPSYPDRLQWPWNRTRPLPPKKNEAELPTITVICPSYNQGEFLEETLRSILLQGYPKLELLVMDGGSTDRSVAIIKQYEKWITDWRSAKDRGQVSAIQEGFEKSSGQIVNHINSDDYMTEDSLWKIAEAYRNGYQVVAGSVENFGMENYRTIQSGFDIKSFLNNRTVFHQPGTWIARQLLNEIGGWDTSFRYLFDLHLVIRVTLLNPKIFYCSNETLAFFRLHASSATINHQVAFDRERFEIMKWLERYLSERNHPLLKPCRKRIQNANWYNEVERIAQFNSRSQKISALLRSIPRYFPSSFCRFTLGALRKFLFS